MARFTSRSFVRSDLPALIRFAQEHTRAMMPGASYYHPGDIAWQLYPFDQSDDVRVWTHAEAAERVAAVAIFEPPLDFQFAVHPAIEEERAVLAAEILSWIDGQAARVPDRGDVPLAFRHLSAVRLLTFAFEADEERTELLLRHGFERGEASGVRFERDLTQPLPDAPLPDGARFRSITDGDADIAARSELHRDAWSGWGTSKFTDERHRLLRQSPLYDPELDIVLEHEGRLVSYCVCWADQANGIGLFEPVGTRPGATQRGFGRAVVREGFRRLGERGMRIARVGTGVVNPGAVALYTSAGFTQTTNDYFFVKRAAAGPEG